MPATIKLDDKVLQKIIKTVGGATIKKRTIADGVEYGIYLEFGTKRMGARPTLRPAFEVGTRDLPEAMGQAIEAAIDPDDVLSKIALDIQALWQTNIQKRNLIDTGAYLNSIHVEEG